MIRCVEICVESPDGAAAASEGGADRVELCRDLAVDGLTPTPDAIAEACRRASIPVHVLVRPRPGDFVHDAGELDAIRRGVEAARSLGAAGVVIGALRPDGRVAVDGLAPIVAAARPLSVTFHRAFDAVADPFAALDDLIALGVDRVLTSGGAPTARAGLDRLAALVQHAGGRIAILAGGRVRSEDLPGLAGAGIAEVHAASAVTRDGRVDPALVREFVRSARH